MKKKRGVAARVGIVMLNLIGSGLGLLRLGEWKTAALLFSVSLVTLLFFSFGPLVPFAILILVGLVGIGSVVAAMWLSWRTSRTLPSSYPRYSRWYAIVGVAAVVVVTNFLLTENRRYRSFYTPAESMAPTLPKNDRFIAFMGHMGPLQRGDLVLVQTPRNEIYVKRVAAIPGDRFAMREGSVVLNGSVVPQRAVGMDQVRELLGIGSAQKLREQFPEERSSHEIYDLGFSPGDDFEETTISNGFVLVLGDNRDRSADSRFPVEVGGLSGPVAIADIVGRPVYQSWGSSRPLGTKLFD
jgi:signal peptidase I